MTQADVDRLKRAAATGELTVEYDGKRVTMRSADELMRLIAWAEGQLAAADPVANPPRTRVSYLAHGRG